LFSLFLLFSFFFLKGFPQSCFFKKSFINSFLINKLDYLIINI